MANTYAGQIVAEYLRSKGISQSHVSRQTGITIAKLNATLNGKRKFAVDELLAICKVVGASPEEILKGGGANGSAGATVISYRRPAADDSQ
jgi:transcriptional regulator with XRE-family HTH domain